MTSTQRALVKTYELTIQDLERKIKVIKDQCQHENTVHHKYVDYDRTRYEVYCEDCEKTLFDGRRFEYDAYKNRLNNNGDKE